MAGFNEEDEEVEAEDGPALVVEVGGVSVKMAGGGGGGERQGGIWRFVGCVDSRPLAPQLFSMVMGRPAGLGESVPGNRFRRR